MRPLRPLLLLALAAALGGCFASGPVVRLYPEGPDVVWREGLAVVSRQGPGYRTAVAFAEAGDQLSFRVEVENTGTEALDVDPARMVYMRCLDAKNCFSMQRVVDPERMLFELDRDRAREQSAQATSESINGLFQLLTLGVAVAGAVKGNGRVVGAALDESGRLAAQDDADRARHQSALAGIAAERSRWAAVALRRTTLGPGQVVGGLVYLPLDTSVSRLWLSVRVSGRDSWFPFRQEVISSESEYRPRPPD